MPVAIPSEHEALALAEVGPPSGAAPWVYSYRPDEPELDPPRFDPPGSGGIPPLGGGYIGLPPAFASLPEILAQPCYVFTLETWTLVGVPSPDELYRWRAVNNGRAAVWARGPTDLDPSTPASDVEHLHAVWIDPAGAVRYRIFEESRCEWVSDSTSATTFVPGASVRWPGLAAHPTNGPFDPRTTLSWLEVDGSDYAVVRVDVSDPALLDALPREEIDTLSPWQGERVEKYLAGALLGDAMVYGLTEQWPSSQLPSVNANRDRVAYEVRHQRSGPLSLRVDAAGSDRASDPSVGSSPDATFAMMVWEEGDDGGASGGGGYDLAFRPLRSDSGSVVSDGSFWVLDGLGRRLAGGDPSVCVLEAYVYLAFQSVTGGGVWLYRCERADVYDGSEPWEPVVDLASGRDDGYLGEGFLANVSGVTVDGTDYVAVAWENGSGALQDNSDKTVEYVCVRSHGVRSFQVRWRRNMGDPTHGVYATAGLSVAYRAQMSPAVIVGSTPDGVTLDLMFFEVDYDGTPGDQGERVAIVALSHHALWFEGGCRCSGVVVALGDHSGEVASL